MSAPTVRMMLRRFTRLTNANSKSWSHHEAAINLGIVYYNFVRKHMTIKKTPAMAAGITHHAWSIQELIETAFALPAADGWDDRNLHAVR